MIYLLLFYEFFKIGLFTFGGGYAMIPLISQAVERHGWASAEMLTNMLAVSESTPGPFSVNMATFVGLRQGGFLGACCSTFGVVLPSFLVILLIAGLMTRVTRRHPLIQGALTAIRPIVVAAIAAAFVSLISKNCLGGATPADGVAALVGKAVGKAGASASFSVDRLGVGIAFSVACFILRFQKVSMGQVILFSALLGIVGNGVLALAG